MSRSFEDLQRQLSEEYSLDLDKQTLEGSVNEMAAALLPTIAAKTGRNVSELRKSFKGVHLDRRPLIEGQITSRDNWRTYEIGISEGILLFHHKIVKLFVSSVSVVGDGQKMVEATRISHDETVSTARKLMASFWAGDFFDTPGFSMTSLTKSQIILDSILLTYSESFVIAHEFGHMILRLFPECVKRDLLMLKGVEDGMVKPMLGRHPGVDQTATLRNWMEELAADFIGINLCVNLKKAELKRTMIQAAGMISLMMCDMLEKYRRKTSEDDGLDPTHPPAELRVEVLQMLLDWPAGMEFGSVFRKFSQSILEKI